MTATYRVPLDMLEAVHVLAVGTTGSGKTYLLRGLLERLRQNGRRVGAIDKIGNHWGLTLDPSGKGPGLEFVIFGGRRPGAIPITPMHGAELGRLFVERNIPAIFDVSQWTSDYQEAFVADFADSVFEHNYGRGPLHLSLDEAQSWAPQGAKSAALPSVRRLIEQGRNNGILLILAVQRLARLDITTRNLSAGVIALRQTGTADRRAVVDLVGGQAVDVRALSADLPLLATGEGFIWDPSAGTLERHRFATNSTYDSSRTPRHGEAAATAAPVMSSLVDELRALLAPADGDDQTEASHVSTGELDELRQQLAVAQARVTKLEIENADLDDECDGYQDGLGQIEDLIRKVRSGHLPRIPAPAPRHPWSGLPQGRPDEAAAQPAAQEGAGEAGSDPSPQPAAGVQLGAERKPLATLVSLYPASASEATWALLAGYARTGGGWQSHRAKLRLAGLIEPGATAGHWRATEAGIAAIGAEMPEQPVPGPELVAFWAERVPGSRKLLDRLVRDFPRWTGRTELAREIGMTASGGAYQGALARIRTAGLLEERGKSFRLAPALMGERV